MGALNIRMTRERDIVMDTALGKHYNTELVTTKCNLFARQDQTNGLFRRTNRVFLAQQRTCARISKGA